MFGGANEAFDLGLDRYTMFFPLHNREHLRGLLHEWSGKTFMA